MTERAGRAASAADARLAALAKRRNMIGEADRILADTLASAHTAAVAAMARLDQIEAEVAAAVDKQDEVALDTAAGALELQRFLSRKQREIATVVSDAVAVATSKKAVLEALSAYYTSGETSSTG